MPRLYLVRHGRAAAGWGDERDPGLDQLGRKQAELAADRLAPLGPLPIIVSPLQRTRETAAPLERRWSTTAIVEPGVGEIPSPTDDLEERQAWLGTALGSTWTELGPRYRSWRTMVVDFLLGVDEDTVVVTHFVAINAVLGAAQGDDRLVVAHVDNASVTVLEHDGDRFDVVEVGATGETAVG